MPELIHISHKIVVVFFPTFSIDVSCPSSRLAIFTFFFLVSMHDFHTLCAQKREKRERENKIVWVCLQSSICTIAFARSYTQCVHIRFIVEKTDKQKEEKKKKKKKEKERCKKDIENIC